MLSLIDKTAVITGAASGIGKAVAILFAKQGATVHLVDINESQLILVKDEIITMGELASVHPCDVTDHKQVHEVFSTITQIDILVNSAGVSHIGKADTTSEEDFDRLFRVNVKGIYNCLHAAIPMMKQRKKAVILNLASIANHVGLTDRFAYSMSKGAVAAMTLSVARDYLQDGIRCNCISPARVHTSFVEGFIAKNYPGKETEMFEKLSKSQPVGRMGTPDEIAFLVLYLCSQEAAFITGCDYPIDGGVITLST